MAYLPTVPGLRLGRRLGQGSLCDVYEAGWRGRRMAVKVLRPENEDDAGLVATLGEELAVGTSVRNDHVVKVRNGQVDKSPFHVVMDHVPGYTLRTILDRDGVLPPWLVTDVLTQAGRGLSALHAAGYVHGDIKPSNIVLDTAGRVTLIDLGFARRPGSRPHGEGILGTPNYLAPELCRTAYVDTPAADLFALGVTAYELLTGTLPYPASDDTDETLLRHRDAEPALLPSNGELNAIVNSLLKVELFQRPKAATLVHRMTTPAPPRRRAA